MEIVKSLDEMTVILNELRLKHWQSSFKNDFMEMPSSEQIIILKHLTKWALTEQAERRSQMINAKIKSARFKKIQTIENFNFSHSKYTLEIQKKYLELYESISSTELPSAIFTGGSGVGKTHLARSLGYATCQKGLSTLFITVAEMVNHLTYAQKTFNLESELQKYKRPQ